MVPRRIENLFFYGQPVWMTNSTTDCINYRNKQCNDHLPLLSFKEELIENKKKISLTAKSFYCN